MPEKFPTIEQQKAEVLPEKKKKKKRVLVSLENEYVVKLREREQELPKDVQDVLDKIVRRRAISKESKNRLKKVYKRLQQEEQTPEELKEQESLGLPKDFFKISKKLKDIG